MGIRNSRASAVGSGPLATRTTANIVLWMGGHGHESATGVYRGYNVVQLPSPASRFSEVMVIRIAPDKLTVATWDYDQSMWVEDESRTLSVALTTIESP